MSTAVVPIDESLATWDADEPRLIGGRCAACRTVTFPRLGGCPKCGSDDIDEALLSRQGTLWTWTTQSYLPKPPYLGAADEESFEPFLLGYVELPEGVMIEAPIVDATMDDIAIGQEMELTIRVLSSSGDRGAVRAFAFRPKERR